ncbi:hypothetical protein AAKU55_000050 [Oxalobacteraceae bacterium GrIS 1.11]
MDQPKPAHKDIAKPYLRPELEQRRPPPDPKQIRRELGWGLLKLERNPHQR